MLRAHKKGAVSYTYSVGDLVKVTIDHLTVRATSTQKPKLQPRFLGLRVSEIVHPGAIMLELP
jgi:hypothetical protein